MWLGSKRVERSAIGIVDPVPFPNHDRLVMQGRLTVETESYPKEYAMSAESSKL